MPSYLKISDINIIPNRHHAPGTAGGIGLICVVQNMTLSWIWLAIVIIAAVYGMLSGNMQSVSSAAFEGASAAVQLCLGMCGATCLWCGLLEALKRAGLTDKLTLLLRPLLSRLLPGSVRDAEIMNAAAANLSANLLGLGNAATPMGIKAAVRMAGVRKSASDDLCTLVVLNTASVQLIPATVAAIRSSLGCSSPFDILPAVWATSAVSVCTGLLAARLFKHFWRD